jgi:hypothetical protein
VIAAVTPTLRSAWPSGWEDVEVVDSEIVEDVAAARGAAGGFGAAIGAARYDGSGRVAPEGRFGRLVSVLA